MLDAILNSLAIPAYQVIFVISGSMLMIGLFEVLFFQKVIRRLLKKIQVDASTLSLVRRPIYLQIFVWSLAWSLRKLLPTSTLANELVSSLYTITIVVWAMTLSQIGTRALLRLSRMNTAAKFIDQQTVGIFLISFRMLLWSLAIYLCFSAWDIDLTGWLASAGVIGVVLGFAAKDTLANLVAGLAILADHSYQVGDFIEIDSSYRGKVTRIGMRATVITTVQDIQIAIPNALLSNGYVVNESAGDSISHRITVPVSVAYGSDLDETCTCLIASTDGLPHMVRPNDTKVLVSELGESGITLNILVWLDEPGHREILIDAVLKNAYRALQDADIEIPFNQLDVRLKS